MNFFEQFKNTGQQIRMSDAEKSRMREYLQRVVNSQAAVPRASPYFSLFTMSTLLGVRSFAALVLVFVVVGSSTAYAAQGSLPGDLLYSVKIGVTEQVELALATTPQAKIDTEVRLAERRVSEAQTLDKEGRLNASTTEEIQVEFDKHVSHALALADEVPDEEDAPAEEATEPTTTTLAVEVATDTATSTESASGTVEVATTVALKVAVLAPQATDTATTTEPETPKATSTATTTRKMYSSKKTGLMISLETKRETLREIRSRYQNRGEVKGTETEDSDED